MFLSKLHISDSLYYYIYILILTVEIVLAVHILIGISVKTTIKLSIILYSVFTLVLVYAFIKGFSSKCGCFGGWVASDISILSIFRNIFILSMLFMILYKNELCFSLLKKFK